MPGPKDALARLRVVAEHGRPDGPEEVSTPADPSPAPERKSTPQPTRQARQPRARSARSTRPLDRLQPEHRGGKRTVFYVRPDLVEFLDELMTEAKQEGIALTRSGIVNQLLENLREGAS